MSQQYARDKPAGFNNRIERVAIVGVSYSRILAYFKLSNLFIRLEVMSANISLKLSSKPESTL